MNKKEIIHNKAKELAMELQETIGTSEHSFDTLVKFFERMALFTDDNPDKKDTDNLFDNTTTTSGKEVLKESGDERIRKALKTDFEIIRLCMI